MFNTLKTRIKNEKGLSLVELLAVIVILAIVAAIAIPAIGNIIENSRVKAQISDAVQVMSAANIYFTDNADEEEFTQAKASGYVESGGKLTSYTVTKGEGTPNTITFTGKDISGKELTRSQLANAKVSGGEVIWGEVTEEEEEPETPGNGG